MKGLAAYVMRGRPQAALVTVGFAVLSMILLPLVCLSGAAVALVTMRKGPREGLIVLAPWIAVWGAMVAMSGEGGHPMVAGFVLGGAWLLGFILRTTINLPLTLTVGAGITALGVALFYALVSDPALWWRQTLEAFFAQLQEQAGAARPEELDLVLERFSTIMTGIVATTLYATTVASLILARWWQAALYNPGGFQREFHAFRLGRGAAAALLVVVLVALLTGGTAAYLATDVSMVLLTLYGFSGLALVHQTVARKNLSVGWLVALYVLTFIASAQMVVLLALLGLSDTWLEYRRFLPQAKGDD